jgi:hypothetical protein
MRKLTIVQDQNPNSPRDEYALGTIAYKHRSYRLGEEVIDDPIDWLEDKMNLQRRGLYNNERLRELEEQFFRKYVALRLYLYDHSGITISTEPFECNFDSGQVGYIYIDKKTLKKEWNIKRLTQKYMKEAKDVFRSEIKLYDQYLKGDIYGFIIEDEEGNHVDSCYGFWGTDWESNCMKDFIPEELHPQLEDIEIKY